MPTNRWKLWERLARDEKIARVYEALFSVEALTLTDIAQKLVLPRTSLYPAIEWLRERALITSEVRGKTTLYRANPPTAWRAIAEEEREQSAMLVRETDAALTGWLAEFASTHRPRVRAYDGEAGIRTIREELRSKGGSIWEYYCVDDRVHAQATMEEAQRITLSSELIGGRVLLVLQNEAIVPPFFDRRGYEVRFLLEHDAPFSGSLTFAGETAYLLSSGEECSALAIESKDFSLLLRSLYLHAWERATAWEAPSGWGMGRT